MKKMILWTVLFLFAVSFALPAAAEEFRPKETYRLQDEMDAFGTHAVDENCNLMEEPSFGADKLWLYEWYNTETGEFKPMGAYYRDQAQQSPGTGDWMHLYAPYAGSPFEEDDKISHCMIVDSGRRLAPSDGAGPVITYRILRSGIISFKASLWSPTNANLSENPNGGISVYVYRNETRIWPETEAQAKITLDTYPETDPKQVSVEELEVTEGDCIRLVVTCSPGTTYEKKSVRFVDSPVVTWHAVKYEPSPYPCGYFDPPRRLHTVRPTVDGFTVCWSATRYGDGYNVYVNGEKANEELVVGTEYTLTGLEAGTIYEVAATSYHSDCGRESAKSTEILARTRNKYDPVTDSSEDATSTDSTTEPTTLPVTDTLSDLSSDTDTVLPSDTLSGDTSLPPDTLLEDSVRTDAPAETDVSSSVTSESTPPSGGSVLPYVCLVVGAVLLLGSGAFLIFTKKRKPQE